MCNITEWAIREFNDHGRALWRDHFEEVAGPEGITAEDIFAYTYAVLHDPVYRVDYREELKQGFPRLPFYSHFDQWVKMGRMLLELHLNFESAEPYPLQRMDKSPAHPEPVEGRRQSGRTHPPLILSLSKDDRQSGRTHPPLILSPSKDERWMGQALRQAQDERLG